jgi:hypothetical protein
MLSFVLWLLFFSVSILTKILQFYPSWVFFCPHTDKHLAILSKRTFDTRSIHIFGLFLEIEKGRHQNIPNKYFSCYSIINSMAIYMNKNVRNLTYKYIIIWILKHILDGYRFCWFGLLFSTWNCKSLTGDGEHDLERDLFPKALWSKTLWRCLPRSWNWPARASSSCSGFYPYTRQCTTPSCSDLYIMYLYVKFLTFLFIYIAIELMME